jgi:hypothetical protein
MITVMAGRAMSAEMYNSILVRGSEWSIIAFATMVRAKAMASVMSRYITDQKSRDDIDLFRIEIGFFHRWSLLLHNLRMGGYRAFNNRLGKHFEVFGADFDFDIGTAFDQV